MDGKEVNEELSDELETDPEELFTEDLVSMQD